jgi:superfamily I DNA and/or RNA helicase
VVLVLYQNLLKQHYIDKVGSKHPMKPGNILIVAPYNMQVNLLKATLPPEARIGTVDKFHGQEALVNTLCWVKDYHEK